MSISPIYVLILAGGSGERFWPLSRNSRPKQLLSLFSGESLLESTIRRLQGMVLPENILILTNADQESAVRELCLPIPAGNIVAEPAKRDTAAAIALGVAWIAARAADATMIVLPADHVIADQAAFQETIRVAVAAAMESGDLVTIGIKPTWACPGFGYIEQGAPITIKEAHSFPPVFEVARFREKPSTGLAQSFLEQGNFRWNAGMFIWTIPAILRELESHASALAGFVREMSETGDFAGVLRERFPLLEKISIDYAILEKASRVLMVEASFDWDDVGSWPAIAKYLDPDSAGNVSNTEFKALEAQNNIIFSNQKSMVALLGVSDLIVVQTADAILVAHRSEAENIKKLTALMPPNLQ